MRVGEASQCDGYQLFPEFRNPENCRPACRAEAEFDRFAAVAPPHVAGRDPGRLYLIGVEEDGYSERAAGATLAGPAMAGGDFDRFSVGSDRKLAA
jgi:hypothetical protein